MGPLSGIRVIEMKGIGPGPYAGQLLADMGADVIVVERSTEPSSIALASAQDVNSRGKRSIVLELKHPEALDVLLKLVESADVFFEGYRPGVAERLGFGPDVCFERNPKLVYGRLTGWGRGGPLSNAAGHDINYISLTGALAAIGGKEKPVPPLNLVGDYAGGSLFLVMGILAALVEVGQSGRGQVVDAAITDGAASLMSAYHGWDKAGLWNSQRHCNFLDGASYYYDVYETADGKFVSIAPLEPQFYRVLVEQAGLDEAAFGAQAGPERWPELKAELVRLFKTRTRSEWCDLLEGTDACFAPVLDYREAPEHPHNRARTTYLDVGGTVQPAPAPRFSRTGCGTPSMPHGEGADTGAVLTEAGYSDEEIQLLRVRGVIA